MINAYQEYRFGLDLADFRNRKEAHQPAVPRALAFSFSIALMISFHWLANPAVGQEDLGKVGLTETADIDRPGGKPNLGDSPKKKTAKLMIADAHQWMQREWFDEAEQLIRRAGKMNVQWHHGEVTPTKALEHLNALRHTASHVDTDTPRTVTSARRELDQREDRSRKTEFQSISPDRKKDSHRQMQSAAADPPSRPRNTPHGANAEDWVGAVTAPAPDLDQSVRRLPHDAEIIIRLPQVSESSTNRTDVRPAGPSNVIRLPALPRTHTAKSALSTPDDDNTKGLAPTNRTATPTRTDKVEQHAANEQRGNSAWEPTLFSLLGFLGGLLFCLVVLVGVLVALLHRQTTRMEYLAHAAPMLAAQSTISSDKAGSAPQTHRQDIAGNGRIDNPHSTTAARKRNQSPKSDDAILQSIFQENVRLRKRIAENKKIAA